MACPFFVDFTRGCIEKIPQFILPPTFDLCESDDYKSCPAHTIMQSPFICQHIVTCANVYIKKIPLIAKILSEKKTTRDIYHRYIIDYCVSQENHGKCVKYKMLSEGKTPPITLFPDGSEMNPIELIQRE